MSSWEIFYGKRRPVRRQASEVSSSDPSVTEPYGPPAEKPEPEPQQFKRVNMRQVAGYWVPVDADETGRQRWPRV